MRHIFLTALYAFLTIPSVSWAEISIFDVRRPIPLNDSDKPPRDFYLNAGTESGLAPGMVLTVIRKTPLYDSYLNRSAGDLLIKVARVKIIHAQRGLAVARLHSEFSRDNNPILEDNYLMVGDQIDLTSASADKSAATELDSTPEPTPKPAVEAAPAPEPVKEKPAPTPQVEAPAAAQKTTMIAPEMAHITVNYEEISP
jgi:hypothetical protein